MADASGSKYSVGTTPAASNGPPPPAASKPVFTPTRSTGGARGFNPLAATGISSSGPRNQNVDNDGWGQDAPPVTRSQLEKVQSAYQPTKVNMAELTSQRREPSRFNGTSQDSPSDRPDVVKGAYQPVGKVDIAAIRAQAQSKDDDRPTTVKGAYEPVGKVDIAAIRAKAQGPSQGTSSPPSHMSPAATGTSTLSDRSVPFTSSERLTTLPKPKVANKFGSSANTFGGTKPPVPGGFGFEPKPAAPAPPVGVGRTFANEAGKSPAQIWAEKKAKERGETGISAQPSGGAAPVSPLMNQTSGGQGWKSGYTGKSWAPVGTTKTGGSTSDVNQQHTGGSQEPEREEPQQAPAGGISSLRDRFANAPPMGAGMPTSNERSAPSPPPLDTSNKPNASRGIPMPGLPQRQSFNQEPVQQSMPVPPPAQPPRSPTPPTPQDSGSPIRVAMPVARGSEPEVKNVREEQMSPPPAMPMHSLSNAIPQQQEQEEEEEDHAAARGAGAAVASSAFGHEAVEQAQPGAEHSGKTAIAQYDYEKAEDNELELKEGEHVTNIEMVDDDWWMGQNSRGEVGLFPSNYVELVEGAAAAAPAGHVEPQHEEEPEQHHPSAAAEPDHHGAVKETGATATAIYDYEAAEDNELSFPDGAKITGVVSRDIPFHCLPSSLHTPF